MEYYAILLATMVFATDPSDPLFQAWRGRQALRNVECTTMPQAQASELYPGQVPPPAPRTSNLTKIDAMVCKQRMQPWGQRPARDELILNDLSTTTGALVQGALAYGGPQTVWRVDAFYPSADVTRRIADAARTALVERGARVKSQAPLLAPADNVVLRELPLAQALPVACARYAAEGALGVDEAFLAVAIVDPQESELHAGVCINGGWKWLQ